MNQVLGSCAGNALEIAEGMRYLRNEQRESRLDEVTMAVCAEMLVVSGLESDREVARGRCDEAVTSGRAAEIFGAMCAALGGPADFVDRFDAYLSKAPVTKAVYADGILTGMNTYAVGNAIIELGGGRRKVGEALDMAVGLSEVAQLGTALDRERPLAVIHAATEDDAARAEKHLLQACEIGESAPAATPVIHEILTGKN